MRSQAGDIFSGVEGGITLNDGVVHDNDLVFPLYFLFSCDGDEGIISEHGIK
jgi:hypothetical protein